MNWKPVILMSVALLVALPNLCSAQTEATKKDQKEAAKVLNQSRQVGTLQNGGKIMNSGTKRSGGKILETESYGNIFVNQTTNGKMNVKDDKQRRQEINDFLTKTMRKKENPQNLIRKIEGQELPEYVIEGGDLYVLKEIPHNNVNIQDDDFFLEDNHDIFPGVLLVADKNLADGNPIILTGTLGVGKVDVSLSFDTGGKRSVKNVNVTYDDIYTAIQELLHEAYKNKFVAPSLTTSVTGDYTSKEQIAIQAGCDVNYAAKFSASVSTDETHTTITHIDDLSQIFYTVIVSPADGDYSNLFGPEVTVDDVKEIYEEYGEFPFVFVNQMSYGRRLYKFSDYRASDFKLDASAKASYSGVSFTSTSNIVQNSEVSNTKVYLMGGDPSLASGLIKDGATVAKVLAKYEKEDGSNEAMIASQKNQGISMSYATKYLGSKQICKRSTTGSYNTAEYRKCLNMVTFKVHAKVDHRGNPAVARVKPQFAYRTLKVKNGHIVARDIQHPIIEKDMKCYTTWEYTLQLEPDEYIDGNIECWVRTKYTKSYKQMLGGNFIDPVKYNGQIATLMYAGTVQKEIYVSESSDIEFIGIPKGKK